MVAATLHWSACFDEAGHLFVKFMLSKYVKEYLLFYFLQKVVLLS